MSRAHKVLRARQEQITLNQIAARGGRAYVEKRLWRQPNETDISWNGDKSGVVGRVQRAVVVSDAGRVSNKITQYLFTSDADRTGINVEWAEDVTGKGDSINNFWMDVNERLTTSQWVWIQVDRKVAQQYDEQGNPRQMTEQEKTDMGDSVVWRVWDALSVPDWSFGDDGKLAWIIVESRVYINTDPRAEASEITLRTLFERRADGIYITERTEGAVNFGRELRDQVKLLDYTEIPFVLVGKISADGWWFDDMEMIQAQCMNLDSLHNENLSKTVFPQLVVPASMVESLGEIIEIKGQTNGKPDYRAIRELIRGIEFPFVETGEDKGLCRYIMPNSDMSKIIPEELSRKRSILFEQAGLALFNRGESRQQQSAESKQFDHLDTESTLLNRALIMQEAEEKLIAFSVGFDPKFKTYEPKWPQDFNIVDIEKFSQAVSVFANLPNLTPSMVKMVQLMAISVFGELCKYDDDLIEAAKDEVEHGAEE